MEIVASSFPWFAITVKPRHEKIVTTALRNKGYTAFLPLYSGRHRHAGRTKTVDLPLFPGYLFCRFDPFCRLPILTIPGVFSIIAIGTRLVPVDEAEITALQRVTKEGLYVAACVFPQTGDMVRIEEGPLRGVQGIFQRVQQEDRLVLSVSLLQRAVSVVIDRAWISPAATGREQLCA